MKIALDAMGGDLAPKAVIEGAVMAARDFKIEVVLVGNREVIARELADHHTAGLAISVEHAAEAVEMDESPLESVLGKPESSIHVGLEMVKRGVADAFVSAGNSGAMMAAAMAILGNLPGVDRPAIASMVPTTGGVALLIDAGANTEVKPINLMQFAVMGSVYWKHVQGVALPRVGLLSNGEEASKGTDLTRAAAAALQEMAPHVNYIGYLEGRDINRAKADVVVTDGFTGNVVLKTMEGFAAFLLGNLREVFGSGWLRRVAFLLVRKKLYGIRERLDPSEYGGAPLLGVNGVVVIAHGSSNARAIRNAVRAAANEALVRHVNSEVVEILAQSPATLSARPSGKGIRGLFSRVRGRLHLGREVSPERKPDRGKAESAREVRPLANGPVAHPSEAEQRPAKPDGTQRGRADDDPRAAHGDSQISDGPHSANGVASADGANRGIAAEGADFSRDEDRGDVAKDAGPAKHEPS